MFTLTQDFDADFDLLTAGLAPGYSGEPYAFIRFGDGEVGIMRGTGHRAKSDGWEWPAGRADGHWLDLNAKLYETLMADTDGLYFGITAHEHHPEQHIWLMDNLTCPWDRVAHAEAFIFANYERFQQIDPLKCATVCPNGLHGIPGDAIATGWDFRPLIDLLIRQDDRSPILVSAGPLANVLIHDYWLQCPPSRRRVILDVGSALDEFMKGRRTRQYQHPDHPQRTWKPRFWPAE